MHRTRLHVHPMTAGLMAVVALAACAQPPTQQAAPHGAVQIYPENPRYLAFDGEPAFLLGAAHHHSWTPISRPNEVDIVRQLDRLSGVIDSIGSPHVRGFVRALPYDPMNHMHDGAVVEVLQPWVRLEDGRYDLERFNPDWRRRLDAFLEAAAERRIVVSLELWDDWSVTRGVGGSYDPGEEGAWNAHPFNPTNNVNYGEDVLPSSTSACDAPFYRTIPPRDDVEVVLRLQQRYVDEVLGVASRYPNVLVNLSNESRAHLDWSRFWAGYVRGRLPEAIIGEMPSTNRRDGGGECEDEFSPATLVTDPLYDYVDVSQGVSNHEFGTVREQALGGGRRLGAYVRAMADAGTVRPLVVSKDYTRGPGGGDVVLWSRFVGGAAAARFHRPAGDHGDEVVRFQLEAIGRLGGFVARLPFWRMHPDPQRVRSLPDGAGVNVLAEPDGHVVVQLLLEERGGRLSVDLSQKARARWIDPAGARLIEESDVPRGTVTLDVPEATDHLILHLHPAE